MHIDLTDLRLFLNVCDAGTLTGGAAATHMTLASASERIRGLEQRVGVPLLVRGRRGVRATPAGIALVQHARIVLARMDVLQGDLAAYGSGARGHIRLYCNTSAITEHLPRALGAFLARHPGLSMDLEERPSHAVAQAVRGGACDLGVASDAVALDGLQSLPFRHDPLVLAVPHGDALAARRRLALAEACERDFVGLAGDSALQAHIDHHARRMGRRLSYRIRVSGLEAVCRLVGQGIGIGVVPLAVARRYAKSAGIARLALLDAWADRRLVICVRQEDGLPQHVRQLIGHLQERAEGAA